MKAAHAKRQAGNGFPWRILRADAVEVEALKLAMETGTLHDFFCKT